MTRRIRLKTGAFQMGLEMEITVVDEAKFARECKIINQFFSNAEYRESAHGSHEQAGLALFAAECFQQIAFNDMKSESWLTHQFNWDAGMGIEGYPDLATMGIEIHHVESWFIDATDIEIEEVPAAAA